LMDTDFDQLLARPTAVGLTRPLDPTSRLRRIKKAMPRLSEIALSLSVRNSLKRGASICASRIAPKLSFVELEISWYLGILPVELLLSRP
jgi:hypothetical protein